MADMCWPGCWKYFVYDKKMLGFAHGNQYKHLPTNLMLKILESLRAQPGANNGVIFDDVKSLWAHVNIQIIKPDDLKVQPNDPDGRKSVFEQLRGAWWMCPEVALKSNTSVEDSESIPTVALITLGVPYAHTNIFTTLGDTYHKSKLARLYSGKL